MRHPALLLGSAYCTAMLIVRRRAGVRPRELGSDTWEGAEADVGGGRVDDVLIDLVGEHQQPRVGRHNLRNLLQQRPARLPLPR